MIHDVKYGQGLSFDYSWIDSVECDEATYNVDTERSERMVEQDLLADKHPLFSKVTVDSDTEIIVDGSLASLHIVANKDCTIIIQHTGKFTSLRLHCDVNLCTVNLVVIQQGERCVQYKTVDCKGTINIYDCLDQEWSQCYNDVNLLSENASSVQKTSTIGTYANVYTRVYHHVSGTNSIMSSRSAVSNELVYRGQIYIPEKVSAVSHQDCDIILLNDDSKAVALPILDVTSQDVECSHGASISTFDETVVRYMSSRGVNQHAQKKLLVQSIKEWGMLP
jgi:hypothetical protein